MVSKKVITAVILAALGVGVIVIVVKQNASKPAPVEPAAVNNVPEHSVIGHSVERRAIDEYTYGNGTTTLLFVGGIHGGYEWNSVILAYTFMDYLVANPDAIPDNLTVMVIPSANPDGVYKIIGKEGRFTLADVPSGGKAPGRFNAHTVDLNRNFNCDWKAKGTWQGNEVSGGTSAFSEPESIAIRDFVLAIKPSAVVFWHSQANGVFPGECGGGISGETRDIMNAYAHASGYPATETFDAYPVTGDSADWLASIHIPALTVELKTHETVEWEKNLKGIQALFAYYGHKK